MKVYISHSYEDYDLHVSLERATGNTEKYEFITEYEQNGDVFEVAREWRRCYEGEAHITGADEQVRKQGGCGSYFLMEGYIQMFCNACNQKRPYIETENSYRENHPQTS